MKKLFLLLCIALAGQKGLAQSVTINKTDGSKVTFTAAEIKNIEFNAGAQQADTILFHTYKGYITVTNSMFQNKYFGDKAEIRVLKTGEKYLCRFVDPQWGDGLFSLDMQGQNISGTGKIKIASPGGSAKEYEASYKGTMRNVVFTIPALMGGTTINWTFGEPPAAMSIAGEYKGTDAIKVGGNFGPYTVADAVYKVVANADGTINVTVPEEQYKDTPMGDLTLGSFTVSNIVYDETAKAFVRDYSGDGIKAHFTAKKNGKTVMDKEYEFKNAKITLKLTEDGKLTVENGFQLGSMPFPITANYTGEKQSK